MLLIHLLNAVGSSQKMSFQIHHSDEDTPGNKILSSLEGSCAMRLN